MISQSPAKVGLYWCSTSDHDEDWFILATSRSRAAAKHCWAEGYDPEFRVPDATLVAILPRDALRNTDLPRWPDNEEVVAAGGEFLCVQPRRVVRFGDVVFVEGNTHATGDSYCSIALCDWEADYREGIGLATDEDLEAWDDSDLLLEEEDEG